MHAITTTHPYANKKIVWTNSFESYWRNKHFFSFLIIHLPIKLSQILDMNKSDGFCENMFLQISFSFLQAALEASIESRSSKLKFATKLRHKLAELMPILCLIQCEREHFRSRPHKWHTIFPSWAWYLRSIEANL